eukprot:CAMPEP_0205818712 /NCGR_PEP_ID=MMETSP0206-20130828/737_1 /ASSEMBLY_ACC=CAM_ASM_000279 /TAXON_ID=36767 /ORGANISM="Euplotes focardii, Strain TN1" /LENGTH=89 /DNA_ID=CAMNT_0053111373 /DNA_START=20 /DNA_END=289 /DNA_ORIENTATION=+
MNFFSNNDEEKEYDQYNLDQAFDFQFSSPMINLEDPPSPHTLLPESKTFLPTTTYQSITRAASSHIPKYEEIKPQPKKEKVMDKRQEGN